MIQIKDKNFVPFIDQSLILQKIIELSDRIKKDYENKFPLFVSVLNGSFMFTADLLKQVNIPAEVCFIKLRSYEGMHTTGSIQIDLDILQNIEDRNLIILEDIIDTGTTLDFLLKHLKSKNPASIKIAALLFKPEALKFVEAKPDYLCFEIENKFVVGYGLDYDGEGRNLKDVYQLETVK